MLWGRGGWASTQRGAAAAQAKATKWAAPARSSSPGADVLPARRPYHTSSTPRRRAHAPPRLLRDVQVAASWQRGAHRAPGPAALRAPHISRGIWGTQRATPTRGASRWLHWEWRDMPAARSAAWLFVFAWARLATSWQPAGEYAGWGRGMGTGGAHGASHVMARFRTAKAPPSRSAPPAAIGS